MQNNYYNANHPLRPYTHSLPAMPGTHPPANALRGETPPTARAGFHPAEQSGRWIEIEDHRGKSGYVNGEPYEIKDFGPLPDGWSDTPPPPTLDEARAAKLAEVMSAYQAAFAPIEAVYPSAEREGWAIQEAEAKALFADPQADPASVAPVLCALVQLRARGETPADLAQKVLANAGQWRMVYAWLTGQQQRMYGEVSGLTTVEEIQAYPVEYQLPEGM